MLSKRATEKYLNSQEFLMKYLSLCLRDPYHKVKNEGGIINLGTAVNQLCEDVLHEKLNQAGIYRHCPEWQHYDGLIGTKEFVNTLATFLSKNFGRGVDAEPANIRVLNGVSSSLEAVAWCICDPGDIILIPTPTYARFFNDLGERGNIRVEPVHLSETDDFSLHIHVFENEILARREKGETVRGILFCNPQNPLGKIYPRSVVVELMHLCGKYDVHLISDEIYGLSVFDASSSFHSVLSFNPQEMPNPDLIHFLWGFSKDFGIAGMRMAMVHSHNKNMIDAIDGMGIFVSVPIIAQQVCCEMLKDESWIDNVYFPTNRKRLAEAFLLVEEAFRGLKVRILKAEAGLFCWLDFSAYLPERTHQAELELFQRLINEAKTYIVPGTEFKCKNPGWFRIIFAVKPTKLVEGLRRIKSVLDQLDSLA